MVLVMSQPSRWNPRTKTFEPLPPDAPLPRPEADAARMREAHSKRTVWDAAKMKFVPADDRAPD
jgi:hypothetical protein